MILAIDSSTTATGYCIRDKDKIVKYGVIKPNKTLSTNQRIIYIENELKALWQKYKPIYIIIEEMNVCRNMQTMRKLIGLIEHLDIEFTKLEALVIRVTPSQYRKGKIIGRRREEIKQQVMNYVNKKYKLNIDDDNIADAILLSEFSENLTII